KANEPEARFCAHCGAKLPAKARAASPDIEIEEETEPRPRRAAARVEEEVERRPRRRRPVEDEDDEEEEGALASLIPARNPRGLTAYCFGIFSLIPGIGLVLGPLALLFGVLGIRYAVNYPKAKGMGHSVAGTLLGILTTIANIVLLVWVIV